MTNYTKTNPELWAGRISEDELYLHEKVQFCSFDELKKTTNKTFGLLGYACEEGVKRNQGRIGAVDGPDVIRKALAKMPNHLPKETGLLDMGSLNCVDYDMEATQIQLTTKTFQLFENSIFPILLGGGHDIAYGHYNAIRQFVGPSETIGIINFDAHFDLRSNTNGDNSGTPFYQIAQECKANKFPFNYMCLGIRKDANDKTLFETAEKLGVNFIDNRNYSIDNAETIVRKLLDFIRQVDHIYVTIDLDGFSSAYAPGVSAPSPLGFSPKIALESLELIIQSKKMISLDIAEMNPTYDIDNHTAKLAASLVHFVIHNS